VRGSSGRYLLNFFSMQAGQDDARTLHYRLSFRGSAKRNGHARPFNIPFAAEGRERPDDPKQNSAKQINWKEVMAEQDDFLRPLVQSVVQQVLEAEMDEALGAEKGECTPSRQGYRSGYYGRTLVTRVGKLELRVPQDRQGRFRTEVFERYQRSEKALVGALTEMYVRGFRLGRSRPSRKGCAVMRFRPRRSAG
jgi:hypothetical protein